jgi:hypothetical protein
MKVALVGWELDEAIAGALALLGLDVVAFTRWHEGLPYRQGCGGWLIERCPHVLGGGPAAEAWSFRESILSRDAAYGVGAGGYDVVHALDGFSVPAAEGLAARNPATIRVASISGEDPEAGWLPNVDRWIANHPWTADRWIARHPEAARRTSVVPSLAALRGDEREAALWPRAGILAALWLPGGTFVEPAGLAAELASARGRLPEFLVAVLGESVEAESVRRHLALRHLLALPSRSAGPPGAGAWTAAVAASRLLIVGAPDCDHDPASWCAWLLGVPVVSVAGRRELGLADSILDLIHSRPRTDRILRAGMARARRRLEPGGIAASWLDVYLSAALSASAPAAEPKGRPFLPATDRSRLLVVPVGPREAFACWRVRPDDWTRALEWLGRDATRASLALRFQNITALEFHGTNAHETWDLTLHYGESQRGLWFDRAGLSLAVSLGVVSTGGAFLELTRAALLHLPSEGPSQNPPTQRLAALPRRSG